MRRVGPGRRAAGGVHRGAARGRGRRQGEEESERARGGIYVHIPFCLTRCGYCDFNAYAGLDHLAPRYLRALLAEADARRARVGRSDRSSSVFLGGGTPPRCRRRRTCERCSRTSAGRVRGRRRRRGHRRRRTPTPWTRPPSAALLEAGLRPAVDGRAVVRSGGARGAGADPSAGLRPRGVRRRPRGRLREREPRPDLRRGRRDLGVVGVDAARDDDARARARERVRAHDRARHAARPAGRRGDVPAPDPDLQADMFSAGVRPPARAPATSTTRSRTGRSPGSSAGTTWGTGSVARTSVSAPARTRSGTTVAGGTSVRPRSTWSASRRGQLPTGGDERLDPSDAYLEEVFLRLRILEGIPSTGSRGRRRPVPGERAPRGRLRSARADRARHAPAERARPRAHRGLTDLGVIGRPPCGSIRACMKRQRSDRHKRTTGHPARGIASSMDWGACSRSPRSSWRRRTRPG